MSDIISNHRQIDAAVACAISVTVALWASAFPGIRAALRAYNPQHLMILRLLVAAIVFVVAIPILQIRIPALRDIPKLAALGGIGITAYSLALYYGETRVLSGAASLLVNTAPIFTALFAAFSLKESLGALGWIGLFVSFSGSALIALGSGTSYGFSPWAGLILLAAICQAIYFVMQKSLLRSYRPVELTAYAMWFSTVLSLIFLPGLRTAMVAAPPAATMAAIYLGVFPAAVAYFAWAFVLSRRSAQEAGSFLYFVPVLAIFIAWLWLGEKPSPLTLIGGAFALVGIAIVNLSHRKIPYGLKPESCRGRQRDRRCNTSGCPATQK